MAEKPSDTTIAFARRVALNRVKLGTHPEHTEIGALARWALWLEQALTTERESNTANMAELHRADALLGTTRLRRRHPDEAPAGAEHELLFCLEVDGERGIRIGSRTDATMWWCSGGYRFGHVLVRWWLPVSELLTGEMPEKAEP